MIGKKINQLATELAPASTDLTIIGNPTTGVSKKITLAQLGAIFSGAVSFYTNYASFPATGTLDVIFCAKDTQKLYLWSGSAYVEVFPSQALLDTYQLRSEKGNANGYASLDSSGKVPVSQLPSSIMEYKGTWSAATNTPTLANGTGDTGDVYICNAAGSVNFGAGSITFAVGDYVIYSGSIWQRSSGAVGTVTSVAASITGNAIGITGSPVTTSGTLAFAFAGTSAQYVNGAGNLITFPSIITQAQNLVTEVYNKTGATLTKGTVVYINGGQGNLPAVTKAIATGDSTSAQTYGIVQADITNMNNGYVVVAGRITDLDTQAYTEGTQLYLSSTTAGAYTSTKQYAPAHLVYVGIVVRAHPTQGVIEVKIQNGYEMDELHNVSAQTPTNNDGLFWEASTSLWKNKSLATIIGGSPAYGSGTQNRITKFTVNAGELIDSNIHDTGSVIYNNNPTNGQFAWQFNGSQTTGLSYGALIVAGTNASDIALRIQNASSTSEYFFVWGDGRVQINNIPNATTDTDKFLVSDSGVIKYRTGTQLLSDIGGQPAGTYVTSVALSAPTGFSVSGSPVTSSGTLALAFDTGYSLPTIVKQNNWDTAYNTRIVTASSPLSFISNTISISQASGSANGFLSSTDWTTFNNKQNALTNPVTGTGTTNYLPKFTGTSTIGNSQIFDNGTYVGIATASPNATLDIGTGDIYVRTGYVTSNKFQTYNGGATQMLFSYPASGSVAFNNGSDRLYLSNTGNLGLGTSSPFAIADTNLSINGSTSSAMQLGVNGIRTGQLFASATEVRLGSVTNVPIRFYTNDGESMRLNASGNLSIGNTNDTYKLDVSGTGRFSGNLRVQNASSGRYFDFVTDSSASYLDVSHILNVRVNGSSSLTTALTIASTGAATFSNDIFARSGTIDSRAFKIYEASAGRGSLAPYNLVSGSGTDYSIGIFSEGEIFLASGGSATKRFTMSTSGAATFSSSVTALKYIANAQATYGSLTYEETFKYASSPAGIWFGNSFNSNNNVGLQLRTSNDGTSVQALTITPTGSVGIGTTSPSRKLEVNGTTGFLDGSYWGSSVGLITFGSSVFYVNALSGKDLSLGSNDTERMRITSGGNVGIGITNPGAKLVVSNSGGTGYEIDPASASGTVVSLFSYDRSAATWRTTRYSGLDHRFETNGTTEAMRIKSTGIINLSNVPSSSAGLASGDVYKTVAGVLMIV